MLGHSRCRDIEALLRGRIGDLEAELDRVRELSAQREKDLLDYILSLTNPGALHALRSNQPAPQRPAFQRERLPIPGANRRPAQAPGSRPVRTPAEAGFRPARQPMHAGDMPRPIADDPGGPQDIGQVPIEYAAAVMRDSGSGSGRPESED